MNRETLERAWREQAQLDAERGVIECRMCRQRAGLDQTLTLWRNGVLVFAVCDRCSSSHDMLLTPTDSGVEVRARRRDTMIVGGRP